MELKSKEVVEPKEFIDKAKDVTAIGMLIQDLDTSSKLQTEKGSKLLMRLSEVLTESYLKKERDTTIKFAFDFYADLSRKMGVPENLISENITHAEIYFNERFDRK